MRIGCYCIGCYSAVHPFPRFSVQIKPGCVILKLKRRVTFCIRALVKVCNEDSIVYMVMRCPTPDRQIPDSLYIS